MVLHFPSILPPSSQQAPSLEAAESTPGTRTRKIGGGASSVFSLFNLKAKSKFWTESVIRTGPLSLITCFFLINCRLWGFLFVFLCVIMLLIAHLLVVLICFGRVR
jgi:hypothetical protein